MSEDRSKDSREGEGLGSGPSDEQISQRPARGRWLDSLIAKLDGEEAAAAENDAQSSTSDDGTEPPRTAKKLPSMELEAPGASGQDLDRHIPDGARELERQTLSQLELEQPDAPVYYEEGTKPGLGPSLQDLDSLELEPPPVTDGDFAEPKTAIYARSSSQDEGEEKEGAPQFPPGEAGASPAQDEADWVRDEEAPTAIRRSAGELPETDVTFDDAPSEPGDTPRDQWATVPAQPDQAAEADSTEAGGGDWVEEPTRERVSDDEPTREHTARAERGEEDEGAGIELDDVEVTIELPDEEFSEADDSPVGRHAMPPPLPPAAALMASPTGPGLASAGSDQPSEAAPSVTLDAEAAAIAGEAAESGGEPSEGEGVRAERGTSGARKGGEARRGRASAEPAAAALEPSRTETDEDAARAIRPSAELGIPSIPTGPLESQPTIQDEPPEPVEPPPPDIIDQARTLALEDDADHAEAELTRELEAEEEDHERQAMIQYELGHLMQTRLDAEARAVKAYATALNLDPLLRPNVWAIRRIFVARKLWPNLLKLQDAEVRFEEEPSRKAEVLLEKGWIQQDQLNDTSGAIDSFWAAHEVNPRWLAPLLALEKVALAAGDLSALGNIYRKMVLATEDTARKAALLLELARLEERRSGGTPQQALQILEEAYALGQDRSGVLELMEQIALHAGLHLEHTGVLRRQADELLRRAEPDARLAAAKLRLAARVAQDHLDDGELAQSLISAALEALPDEPQLQNELLELSEDRGDWSSAASLIEKHLETESDALRRANLWHRLGLARMGGGDVRAAEAFERAREELPGFLPVLVAEERRLLAAGDLEALSRLWVSEAEAVERSSPGLPLAEGAGPSWSAAALWRAASLRQQLGQTDQAIELCRRALLTNPGFEPARDDLEVLLRRSGQHGQLAALLEEQLGSAPPEEAPLILESLLALYAGPLDDPERLLSAVRRLSERRQGDRRLLRLEAHVLERLGRFADVAETLRLLESGENDVALLCSWKLSRARLLEGPLDRAEEAVSVYQEILDRQPDHSFALAGLEALLRRLARYQDLATLLRTAADQCLSTEEGQARRLRLLRQLGVLLERQLGRPKDAVVVFSEIVAAQRGDQTSLRDLARVATIAGDAPRLAEALEGMIERAGSLEQKARLQIRLSEVLDDQLSDPLRAEELLNQAVDSAADPALVPDVIDALARRKLVRGDISDALRAMESLEAIIPAEAARAMLEERAWLSAGPAGESERGEQLWTRVLEQDPDNRRALLARLRVAARERRAGRVAEITTKLASLCQDPVTASALQLRAGTLAELAGDPAAAAEAYQAVRQQSAPPLEAVCGLLARSDVANADRAELLQKLALHAPDRIRDDMRLNLAETCERAGHQREARQELLLLLEKDHDNLPALFIAQRLAEAAGNLEQEACCWTRIGQALSEPASKADALSKAAELFLQLSRADEAVTLLRQVLVLRPKDQPAYERLRQLYHEGKNDRGLDELLGHQIQHADNIGSRITLHMERAELRLQKLSDRSGAARELLSVLRLEPRHLEALRQLSRLYDEDGNAARALELYQRYLELVGPVPVKRPAVLRMVDLLVGIGRTAEAVDVCRRFLDQSPEDEDVLGRLAELYVTVKDFPHAVTILERLGNMRPDREWRARQMRRMALLYWKELKDLSEARNTLLQARDLDPGNMEILGALRQVCRQMGQPEQLKRVLERAKDDLRESLMGQPHSVKLYRELMQVSEWDEDEYTLLAAMGALCALGVAEREDRELYGRRVAKVGFEPKRQVASKTWRDALIDPGAKSAYGDVWAQIAEAVPRLFEGRVAGDPGQLGVGRSDRVDRRSGGRVSAVIDRIAATFGILDFDVFVTSRDPDFIGGMASDRPAVVVGHQVVTSLSASRRFRLGRLFALMRERAVGIESLSHDELEILFAAAVFLVEPGASFSPPRSQVEAEARRLTKVLSKRGKKGLQLAVPRLLQEGGDLDNWVQGLLTTANRAGLLVCGDVIVALDEMIPELREVSREQRSEAVVELLRERPAVARVLAFSVGREYLNLRRELQV